MEWQVFLCVSMSMEQKEKGNKKSTFPIMQYTNFNQIICTGKWSESGQCMIRGVVFFSFSYISHFQEQGIHRSLLTFLKYSLSLLYSDSTTRQKILWNGWPDLQVTDIIIIVVIYNSRQMWRGPYQYIYMIGDATKAVFILLLQG